MPTHRSVLFESPWCRLVVETLPGGDPYYMVDVPDYVGVVARTAAGRLLLVQQYRPVVGRVTVELPSGHVDPGEAPEAAARRELFEETGATASDIELLGVLVPDVGRLTNRMWCYFAPNVVPAEGPVTLEEGITLLQVPEADALAMAVDGRIDHALNLAVLFMAVMKGKLSAV